MYVDIWCRSGACCRNVWSRTQL